MESKLLIIMNNQQLLFNKLKDIENRLTIIEKNTSVPVPVPFPVITNEDLVENETVLLKPQIKPLIK